jgi:hypothetical protein
MTPCLTMLEFLEDGQVVCVCSVTDNKYLPDYIKRCRKKFKLGVNARAYLRSFQPIGHYSGGFRVASVRPLDV